MIALILAGGFGTRLWPLSRALFAKQFLNFNSEHSLLQETVKKAKDNCDDVVIVTNDSQYFLVKHQLQDFGIIDEHILREPTGKNTGPAIALGCKYIEENFGNESVLVMPSDHILDENFFEIVRRAKLHAKEKISVFGILPTYPATGYGYIKKGKPQGHGFIVDRFSEKPDTKTAQKYIDKGDFLWNSGIFLFSVETIMEEFKAFLPEVYAKMSSTQELLKTYHTLPEISIDVAIMEKSKNLMIFPYNGKWTDVGSWKSVYEILEKDKSGNSKTGDIISISSENSLIFGKDRLIATIGIRDLLIVDTKDALLVSKKEDAEKVMEVVDALSADKREEVTLHKTVYRPWGYYTVLEKGPKYKVKRIAVYPGKSISYQLHKQRAEHWIVVSGIAKITKEDEIIYVNENQSIYVPISMKHRIENDGLIDLHIIEIQTGDYVEEDDIIRIDDEFGRA